MVIAINGYADGLAHKPMVWQRLRPQRIDFEPRSHHTRRLHSGLLLQHHVGDPERRQDSEKTSAHAELSFHTAPPWASTLSQDGALVAARRRSADAAGIFRC